MQALDLLEQYADLILELHNQSTGLGDLIAKCLASNQDLAGLSEATYRKLLPGFIRGLEIGMKRISDLESQLNNQIHEHAMDIEIMNQCINIDTIVKATAASVPAVVISTDTSIDTNVDTLVDTNVDTMDINNDTIIDTTNDTMDMNSDTIAQQVLNTLMPMIEQTVRRLVNGGDKPSHAMPIHAVPATVKTVSSDTTIDTSIDTSRVPTDTPARIKGYRVNYRKDGRYVLLNGKTTIYIGKQWDMDKALRLIAEKETASKGQQVPLLA